MSRFPGGMLCAAASVMLLLCAFHLWARESVFDALFVGTVGLVLLLAAVASLKEGVR